MAFCTKCGKQNPETAKFCTACGADLSKQTHITGGPASQHTSIATVQEKAPLSPEEIAAARRRVARNTMTVTGILSAIAVFILVYYFFIKPDPARDGKKVAASFCECRERQNEKLKSSYTQYIADLGLNKFQSKGEAQKALTNLVQSINDSFQNCYTGNQAMFETLKRRYLPDDAKSAKFDLAYSDGVMLCNGNDSGVTALYSEVVNKMNQYMGPAEREQGRRDSLAMDMERQLAATQKRQDSIAMAQNRELAAAQRRQDSIMQSNAQLQLANSLEYAAQNPPNNEGMKQDIRGKSFKLPANELGWPGVQYDRDVNFLSFKSSNNSFQKDSRTFTSDIDMVTGDDKKMHCNLIGTIAYTWDDHARTWNFKNMAVHEFRKIKEPEKNTSTAADNKPVTKKSSSEALNGNWTGMVVQGRKSYSIRLSCNAGTNEFKINYGSLGCSGYWSIEKKNTDRAIDFREHILTGRFACVDGDIIHFLLISDDKAQISYVSGSKNIMRVLLTKE